MIKKNILFLLQLPPPIHGASKMNSFLVNSNLLKENFNIKYINLDFVDTINQIGKYSHRKIFKTFLIVIKLIKLISKFKPDLIYLTISPKGLAFYRDLFFVFLVKLWRIKLIYHLHGKGIQDRANKNLIIKVLYKLAFSNVEVICLSNSLIKDTKGIYKKKPFIVGNAIPEVVHLELIKKKSFDSCPVLIFLSNLIPSKGILDFLNALSILEQNNYNFKAYIIGAESKEFNFFDLDFHINTLKLKNIEVVGPKYDFEKFEYLLKGHILIFPTYYINETWGLVILEAMQCGLAIISTPTGAIPDIIQNGINGFIVDIKSPEAIANKLKLLLNDRKLLRKFCMESRELYEKKFKVENFEENIVKVFHSVLER